MKKKTLNYSGNKMILGNSVRDTMTLSVRIALIISLIIITSLIFFSSPCHAKITLTAQVAYGGVICGGVGLCLYFSRSFLSDLRVPDIMPALLTIRSGKIVLGIPAIECGQSAPEISLNPSGESYNVRFLRWEF
jgi:hypothetical protein